MSTLNGAFGTLILIVAHTHSPYNTAGSRWELPKNQGTPTLTT